MFLLTGKPNEHSYRTCLVAFAGIAVLCGCKQRPRWESTLDIRGESQITVRAPLLQGPNQVRLEHIKTIDGSEFPLSPGFISIEGITTTGDGRVLIGDRGRGTIVVLDSTGAYQGTMGRPGPAPFEISERSPTIPMRLGWLEGPRTVVVDDWIQKILLVPSKGKDLPTSWSVFPPVEELAAGDFVLILVRPLERPFFQYTLAGAKVDSFGCALRPDDAAWPVLSPAIEALEDIRHPRGNMVSLDRLPDALGIVGDSLLVHDVPYRNSIRAWSIESGEVRWQLNVESPDYEPPTLFNYQKSGSNELARWNRRDPAEIFKRDYPLAIRDRMGLLYVIRSLRGYGKPRRKPDHRQVTAFPNEFTELNKGIVEHAVLDIFSLRPDWIAHVTLESGTVALADVAPHHILVLAFNEPTPRLEFYRVIGLEDWQERVESGSEDSDARSP